MTIIPNAPELLNDEQRSRLIRQRENEKRITRERSIVRGLIRALKSAGWMPVAVDDGGDVDEKTTTESVMIEAIFAVDQATAKFKHEGHPKRCCVVLVCGEGNDIIADHSAPDGDPCAFAATIDAFMRAKGLI